MNKNLTYHIASQSELEDADKTRMFQIFQENYDFVDFECFKKDLNQKQYVVLLKNSEQEIQGFSTIAIDPGGIGSNEFSVVFSGDTIIAQQYWGTQELVKGFGNVLGRIYAGLKSKKLYWFLISKGHRTYLYLPLFFKQYYPSPDACDVALKSLVERCSASLFPGAWSASNGTIRFSSKLGQLKPRLAEATWKRSNNRYVQYFLQRNPSFQEGTELACMAEVRPENILGRGRKFVLEGMSNPLVLST